MLRVFKNFEKHDGKSLNHLKQIFFFLSTNLELEEAASEGPNGSEEYITRNSRRKALVM